MEKEKGFALNYYEIISPSRFSRVEDSDPEANVNRETGLCITWTVITLCYFQRRK